MNKKVEKRLSYMKQICREIKSQVDCILQDIEDVVTDEDLYIIEHGFERIRRAADETVDYVRETYDEFEEE